MQFCTVVARNYLAYARVLASSLHALDDDITISVLVLDDVDATVDEREELFEVVRPADLDIEPREFHHMATIYSVLELATALKPWLLRRLLEHDDVVCYLDPDIEVFGSLTELEARARKHSIVLTPHSITPLPRDGLIPSELTIRQAGVFNLGFIAVSRGAMPFLSWWEERLRRECRIAPDQGLFVDQRWVDFVPSYFEYSLVTDEGYNVAYWNLFERELKRGADGYEVNGRPLRFYHYSGFDPLKPYALSKHQFGKMRIRLEDNFDLAYLCSRYADQLLAAGHVEAVGMAYRYNYTARGIGIDDRARRLYLVALTADEARDVKSRLPDPFDPDEADAFMTWLDVPDPLEPQRRLSRYLRGVYDDRPDIAAHFPELSEQGEIDFLEWIGRHGRGIAGVPPDFMPPPKRGPRAEPGECPPGVNVVGYLRAEDGLGSVARSLIDVLALAETPMSFRTCSATDSRQAVGVDAFDHLVTYDTTIACVNADQLPLLDQQLREAPPVAVTTVGIWAWEVDVFPQWMARSAALVDEVWVYSRHAADAVEAACAVPVHVFAPPVSVPESLGRIDRAAVDITDDFTFLFCFDFASIFERKNPLAVIDAFCRAFAPGAGPRLVIKSVNGGASPLAWARLDAAIADRPDIVVRDGYETAERQRDLMAACDCYVSLHRAEGYGLTMAEAMAVARPVIGTAYSGNLEFMTPDTSVLIPYEKVRVPFGCGPYPPTAWWAEPDIDAAAEAMRTMASDPTAAALLGARARAHIEREHTAASRVDLVGTRLHDLRNRR
jgi:glycosyltransferase involved in cell wall biosynthesis